MPLTLPYFDTAAPPGLKFVSPEVRDELGDAVPMTINPGAITEPMLATGAVSTRALGAGVVTTAKMAAGSVVTATLADGLITDPKLGDDVVTPRSAAAGIMTCTDNTGGPIALTGVPLTAAQYAALPTKDPNTLYFVHT